MPMFYIGYTKIDKYMHNWDAYRGSVSSKRYKKVWLEEQRENPQLFKTNIISFHFTKESALEKEEYFHRKFNVINNPLYINQSISYKKFSNLQKGYRHSLKTKEKISNNRKGKGLGKKSSSVCLKISESLKGHEVAKSTRNKLRDHFIGMPLSEEHKKHIKEAQKSFICNTCSKEYKTPGYYRHIKYCKEE